MCPWRPYVSAISFKTPACSRPNLHPVHILPCRGRRTTPSRAVRRTSQQRHITSHIKRSAACRLTAKKRLPGLQPRMCSVQAAHVLRCDIGQYTYYWKALQLIP